MKQYIGIALGMVAGSVLGAAAVTGLSAQVKAPSVHLVTEVDLTNPDAYGKNLRRRLKLPSKRQAVDWLP
jgi:hypothetical protein